VSDLAGTPRRTSGAPLDDGSLENAGAHDGFAMDERSEEAGEVDGVVGFSLQSPEGPLRQSSQVYVSAPDGPSGSWAMGLDEDVRLLARAFAEGGTAGCRKLIDGLPSRSAGKSKSPKQKKADVRIALHGRDLDSGDKEELLDLIWALVEKRSDGNVVRP
jgi:hypothetical protein